MARHTSCHGFTLVEMLVALAILSLVIGLAVGAITSTDSRRLDSESARLLTRLNHAADLALMRGDEIAWHHQPDSANYRFLLRGPEGEWRAPAARGLDNGEIGANFLLLLQRVDGGGENQIHMLHFFPGGQYTPFTLTLADRSRRGYVLSGDGFNTIRRERLQP